MKISSKILAAVLFAATIFGCEPTKDISEAELTSFIPASAKAVVSIDLTSLKTKAGSLEKAFDGANEAGVKDIFENTAFGYFTVLQKEDGSITLLGLARLDDAKAFKKKLGEVVKTVDSVQLYALTHRVKSLTEVAIEGSEETDMKIIETTEVYGYAGLKNNVIMTLTSPNMENIDEKAIDELATYFGRSENNLLKTEPTFREILAEKKDFSIWVNGSFETNEATVQMLPRQYRTFLENINMKGAFTTATLNFEKGAVVADYFFQGNKEYIEKYADAVKENLESNTVEKFKVNKPSVVISYAFNPEKIQAILKETGTNKEIEELVNMNDFGFTVDDLVAMMNGDILIAVGTINLMEQNADVEILIGVKDESKVKGLLDLFVEKEKLTIDGDVYAYEIGADKLLITVQDEVLIITKNNAFGLALLKGEGEADPLLAQQLATNSSVVFINPSKIPYSMLVERELATELDKVATIEFLAKKGEEGKATAALTVNLNDKEKNALLLLNEALVQ